jgi:hypothetical protein
MDDNVLEYIAVQHGDRAPAESTTDGPNEGTSSPVSGAIPDVLPVATDFEQLRDRVKHTP